MDLETDMLILRCGLVTADEIRARVHAVQRRLMNLTEPRERTVNCGDFNLRIMPDWGQS